MIQTIRESQPGYNLIKNNCQTYALQLLDAIKVGTKKEFGTTLTVYERLVGPGRVADLFVVTEGPEEAAKGDGTQQGTVSLAQQVMHENTTQLDTQEEMNRHAGDHDENPEEDGGRSTDKEKMKHKMSSFLNKMMKK